MSPTKSTPEPQQLQVEAKKFRLKIKAKDIRESLKNGSQHFDTTLVIVNVDASGQPLTKKLYSYDFLLSLMSPILANLVNTSINYDEFGRRIVQITNTDVGAFKHFLQFIHFSNVHYNNIRELLPLHELAKRYNVIRLEEAIMDIIKTQIESCDEIDVQFINQYAKEINDKHLEDICFPLIINFNMGTAEQQPVNGKGSQSQIIKISPKIGKQTHQPDTADALSQPGIEPIQNDDPFCLSNYNITTPSSKTKQNTLPAEKLGVSTNSNTEHSNGVKCDFSTLLSTKDDIPLIQETELEVGQEPKDGIGRVEKRTSLLTPVKRSLFLDSFRSSPERMEKNIWITSMMETFLYSESEKVDSIGGDSNTWIVVPPGKKIIKLKGYESDIKRAEDLLFELFESKGFKSIDRRLPDWTGDEKEVDVLTEVQYGCEPAERYVFINAWMARTLIGPNGCHMRAMRESSGCWIRVSERPTDAYCVQIVGFIGTHDQVKLAMNAAKDYFKDTFLINVDDNVWIREEERLEGELETASKHVLPDFKVSCRKLYDYGTTHVHTNNIYVSPEMVSALMGKNGCRLASMNDECRLSGCKITIEPEDVLQLTGSVSALKQGRLLAKECLSDSNFVGIDFESSDWRKGYRTKCASEGPPISTKNCAGNMSNANMAAQSKAANEHLSSLDPGCKADKKETAIGRESISFPLSLPNIPKQSPATGGDWRAKMKTLPVDQARNEGYLFNTVTWIYNADRARAREVTRCKQAIENETGTAVKVEILDGVLFKVTIYGKRGQVQRAAEKLGLRPT